MAEKPIISEDYLRAVDAKSADPVTQEGKAVRSKAYQRGSIVPEHRQRIKETEAAWAKGKGGEISRADIMAAEREEIEGMERRLQEMREQYLPLAEKYDGRNLRAIVMDRKEISLMDRLMKEMSALEGLIEKRKGK